MAKYKRRHKKNSVLLIGIAVIAILIFISTGYALWSDTLYIKGTANTKYKEPKLDSITVNKVDNQYLKAKEILKKYNQEHLLAFYDKLTQEKKEKLINQILNINFEQINKLYENTKKPIEKDEEKIEPITYIDKNNISDEERKYYKNLGIEEIKKGKLAAVTMAGGQGTRLRT